MTYNALLDGFVEPNALLSSATITSSGVSNLADGDVSSVSLQVSSGTAVIDCTWGDAYKVSGASYYISDLQYSSVSGSYGLSAFGETTFVASSSGTYYHIDIDSDIRYFRLFHTATGVSSVYQLSVEGTRNDTLYFSSFQDYGAFYYDNTPIGLVSSSPATIGITNSGTMPATAAVSVAPTASGSDHYFLLSDTENGQYYSRVGRGYRQPVFLPITDISDTFVNSDLSAWDIVRGPKAAMYSDSSGLNLEVDGCLSNRVLAGPTAVSIGLVSKEAFSGSQSFTMSVKLKMLAFGDTAWTPHGLFFGVTNTWPIKDPSGGVTRPVDRSFFRKGRSFAASWMGCKGDSDIYIGGAKVDGNYREVVTNFHTVGGLYGALSSAIKLQDFNQEVLFEQTITDGTSTAPWRTLSLSYDHIRRLVRVFFDDVELSSCYFNTEPVLDTFRVFLVYAGGFADASLLLKDFSITADSVKHVPVLSYTALASSTADSIHTADKLGDGNYGDSLGSFSWVSGLNPSAGDTISFRFSSPETFYGIRLQHPSIVVISGSVVGNPNYYIDTASLEFDSGDQRYLFMDGTALAGADGWEVHKFITSSGTAEPVTASSGVLTMVIVGERAVSSPLDVMAIDEFEFLSDVSYSVPPTIMASGLGASWDAGNWVNGVVRDSSLSLRLGSASRYDVSSVEVCETLVSGVDYGFPSPVFWHPEDLASTGEQYHYGESVFKLYGRGSGDIIRASALSGPTTHIWKKLHGRVEVSAVLLGILSLILGGKPDKWKLQYLVESGDPTSESDWIDIPVIATPYHTPCDYKTYRDYLISNNDGQFYTTYINAYDATGYVAVPSDTYLALDEFNQSLTVLTTFTGTEALIYIEFDTPVETDHIRFVVADGYEDVLRTQPVIGYTFGHFVVFSEKPYLFYESPVLDTEFSLNSEKLVHQVSNSSDYRIRYRSSDTPPAVSEGFYECWEDLGESYNSLDYGIAFSSEFAGVGIHGTKAYFGFYSYFFGKDIIYICDLETGKWSEGPEYPQQAGVGTRLDPSTWGNCVTIGGTLYFAAKTTGGGVPTYPIMKYGIEPDQYGITGWTFVYMLRQLTATNAAMVKISDDEIFFLNREGYITVLKVATGELTYDNRTHMPTHGQPQRMYFVPAYANGKIYVAGGFIGEYGVGMSPSKYMDIYDLNSNTWSPGAPAPYNLGSTWCIYKDGYVYVLPVSGDGQVTIKPYLKYDVSNDSWQEIPELGYSRAGPWPYFAGTTVGNAAPPQQYFTYGDYIYGVGFSAKIIRRFLAVRKPWSSGEMPYRKDSSWNSVRYRESFGDNDFVSQGRYIQYKIQAKNPDKALSSVNEVSLSAPLYVRDIPSGAERNIHFKTSLGTHQIRELWYTGRYATYKSSVVKATSYSDDVFSIIGDSVSDYSSLGGYGLSYGFPFVIKIGKEYRLWASAVVRDTSDGSLSESSIQTAISVDGLNWSTFNEVIPKASEGTYDVAASLAISILPESGQYTGFYTGKDTSDVYRILKTTSTDAGISWSSPDLVVDIGNLDADASSVMNPSIVYDPTLLVYVLYYEGRDSSGLSSVIRCVSSDTVVWSGFSVVSDIGGFYPKGWSAPFVHYDGTQYRVWFIGRGNTVAEDFLFFASSADGIVWSAPVVALSKSSETLLDTDSIGKCCVVLEPPCFSVNDSSSFQLRLYNA